MRAWTDLAKTCFITTVSCYPESPFSWLCQSLVYPVYFSPGPLWILPYVTGGFCAFCLTLGFYILSPLSPTWKHLLQKASGVSSPIRSKPGPFSSRADMIRKWTEPASSREPSTPKLEIYRGGYFTWCDTRTEGLTFRKVWLSRALVMKVKAHAPLAAVPPSSIYLIRGNLLINTRATLTASWESFTYI